jgi:hypothetical protein
MGNKKGEKTPNFSLKVTNKGSVNEKWCQQGSLLGFMKCGKLQKSACS